MKLSLVSFLSTIAIASADDPASYVGVASATLSTNVAWTGDPQRVVDGDLDNEPWQDKAVYYHAPTCNVSDADLGYVTVDLGSSQELSGVYLFMHNGGGRQYCNLHVNVWDTNEPAPDEPFGSSSSGSDQATAPAPVDTVTINIPSPPPTSTPTTVSPTASPTPPPTPPPVQRKCYQCGDYDTSTPCSMRDLYLGQESPCPPGQDYCMSDYILEGNKRSWYKRCADYTEVVNKWLHQTSDLDVCTQFGKNVESGDYSCHWGCTTDGCNKEGAAPPDKGTLMIQNRRGPAPVDTVTINIPSPATGTPTATPTSTPTTGTPTATPTPPPTPPPVPAKPAIMCKQCGDYDNQIPCGLREIYMGQPSPCPADKPYCMTDIIVLNDSPNIYHRCADETMAFNLWWRQTSDQDHCTQYGNISPPHRDYQCHFACTTDGCNSGAESPDPNTYKMYNHRRRLAATTSGTNIYTTGQNHEFGPVFPDTGLPITISPPRKVRYIRVWSGRNTVDDTAAVIQVFGMRPTTSSTASGLSNPLPAPANPFPAPGPSPAASPQGGGNGDPHFKTWNGTKYDFHGGCDLVLIDNPHYGGGKGMTIHVRTEIDTWWSFIETVVVKIGDNTLEVKGGKDGGQYWMNGEEGKPLTNGMKFLFSGLTVNFKKASEKQMLFRIALNGRDAIGIQTYNRFVSINLRGRTSSNFQGSRGLMGSYPEGTMLARDGVTVLEDPIMFGKEWQVQADEPMLFRYIQGVQAPQECAMPSMDASASRKKRRRLGETLIDEEAAKLACASVDVEDFDHCVYDVLATNDVGMVGAY